MCPSEPPAARVRGAVDNLVGLESVVRSISEQQPVARRCHGRFGLDEAARIAQVRGRGHGMAPDLLIRPGRCRHDLDGPPSDSSA
jgi:hypothetical protein